MTDRLYVDAAAELRRLRSVNIALIDALQRLVDLDTGAATDTAQDWDDAISAACAALDAAYGAPPVPIPED